MPEIEVTARPTIVSGAPGPAPERPRVELVLSTDTGAADVRRDDAPPTRSRAESLARIKERAARGDGGKPDSRAEPVGMGPEGDDAADEATDETAGQGGEGEEVADGDGDTAAASGDDAADAAAAEGGESEDKDAAPDGESNDSPDAQIDAQIMEVRLEAERLARERDRLEERVARYEAGLLGEEARAAYAADPVRYIRDHIASLFGVDPNDEDLATEVTLGLLTDLTAASAGDGLSADKRAQIRSERIQRHWQLDQKSRQASKQVASSRHGAAEVERYIDDVAYKAVADKFPHLALAAEFDGVTPGKAVAAYIRRAVPAGHLKVEGRSEADVLTEAFRHLNHSYKTRAEKLVARATALGPAPAPKQPPAGPGQPKQGAPKQTTTAKPKPRTLSAAEAAQPSAKKQPPGPKEPAEKVITVVRDPDAEEARRRALFAKYRAKQQQ